MSELPKSEDGDYAGDVIPSEAWEMFRSEPGAVLIDVRTDAEFNYVGRPDLSSLGKHVALVMWVRFPDNTRNPDFVANVKAMGVTPNQKLLFLCRSGVRSRHTAAAMTDAGFSKCFNISVENVCENGKSSCEPGPWALVGLGFHGKLAVYVFWMRLLTRAPLKRRA